MAKDHHWIHKGLEVSPESTLLKTDAGQMLTIQIYALQCIRFRFWGPEEYALLFHLLGLLLFFKKRTIVYIARESSPDAKH